MKSMIMVWLLVWLNLCGLIASQCDTSDNVCLAEESVKAMGTAKIAKGFIPAFC